MERARPEESLDYLGTWSLFLTFLALFSPNFYSLFFAFSSAFYLWKAIAVSRATGTPLTIRGRLALVACPLVLIWTVWGTF